MTDETTTYVKSKLKSELLQGEKIVWCGRPVPRIFDPTDLVTIPFSLLWAGFAFHWEYSVVNIYLHTKNGAPTLFLVLWGIPFCCIGINMLFLRFFTGYYRQLKTAYALTNQRVIIIHDGFKKSVQSQSLAKLPPLLKVEGKNGVGSIYFGDNLDALGRSGFAPAPVIRSRNYRRATTTPMIALTNIKSVDKVCKLINQEKAFNSDTEKS